MYHSIIYIVLGIFDAFAMLLMILKLFMLPVYEYRNKILIFVFIVAIFSYFMRVVFEMAAFDLPIQYVLFVIFLRVFVKIKLHIASFIAGAGISAYATLQVCLYYIFDWTNVVDVGILRENSGMYLYMLQITAIVVAYLLTYLLFRQSKGFTFILVPPHDFFASENYLSRRNVVLIFSSIISLITISITILLLYSGKPLNILLASIVSLAISAYFSNWSDKDDIRKAITAYRNRNKNG
ncbi:hypothetical protein [Paenibacillus sp. P46E]|uniref:hypothetical protein n=1 Tax=Paenibacillus sp. P46E TaxID=1349436 RepID=UPI0009666DD0|nr:hypothetical protein [Paenibacillus sp. P46E]OKP96832.1 hypothetical protein A3849_19090 [Paenibacillus sp. P46E]